VTNSIARRVRAARATVSACSCVPTCDSSTESSVLVEVNFAIFAPGFPPGTDQSSSPVFALPVISDLPDTSQAPTSTLTAGLRKFATGRNVFRSSPKLNSTSESSDSSGRSKCSSLPSTQKR